MILSFSSLFTKLHLYIYALCAVSRTSSTHKLGLHDVVEESFEKLKNSDSHSETFDGQSKFLANITRT